ncbi:unnamed protein product [Phaedon cochleariae]|uniref:Uncharacterized protein n=1 Tax=Phaedon cochleariae TaxID=80249 RepID=A0A9P0GQN0_PHACE|nr:unnamed protein product [Phaedon cochleariae]
MFHSRLAMSSVLLLSILGASGTQHCPMWREIAPCTCRLDSYKITSIACDNMTSFEQVESLLRGRFHPMDRVSLRLAASNMRDLEYRAFKELNMTIENLKLNRDYIGRLNPETFEGLTKVNYLSLADNVLEDVPQQLWKEMPNVKTLDLGRTKIKTLTSGSFSDLKQLECLVLPGNQISEMDVNSIPQQVQRLHIGRNYIEDLNSTLRNLSELGWLFINCNRLTNLDNQLPRNAPNLKLIHASHNFIERLPRQLKNYPLLESIFFQNNKLKSLDGAISKSNHLMRAVLEHNQINTISENDFAETEMLESLLLGHNEITSLNNSLLSLRNLNFLNLAYNRLVEFSFQEVADLRDLRSIDLSYNRIETLIGPATLFQNLVDWNSKLTEIKLDHNNIETLNGALSGLSELLRLNLSFNKLKKISPEDLIGLEQLRLLDISHNHLTTLEETSKTYLPRLSELKASHNYLTILERDFHGLPVLCHADLSNNEIVALGKDLVAKTRCTIEHGVHEGTWDTLKIYLQDNPILCDAALPDIMSVMEINHTRIYGVSHNCPPLSEQPTTSKPNAFFGYIPESTPSLPTVIAVGHNVDYQNEQNHANNSDLELGVQTQYAVKTDQDVVENQPIVLSLQKPQNGETKTNDNVKQIHDLNITVEAGTTARAEIFDPVQQGKQINKLASEIEELRSRIDELSSQNKLLLQTQLNNSIVKSGDTLSELRKP